MRECWARREGDHACGDQGAGRRCLEKSRMTIKTAMPIEVSRFAASLMGVFQPIRLHKYPPCRIAIATSKRSSAASICWAIRS
jgi:hypothetical protein